MITYAKTEQYDIKYDEIQQEFYITSKVDGHPMIGSFKTPAEAIDFAEKRVVQNGARL